MTAASTGIWSWKGGLLLISVIFMAAETMFPQRAPVGAHAVRLRDGLRKAFGSSSPLTVGECWPRQRISSHRSIDIAMMATIHREEDARAAIASMLEWRSCHIRIHLLCDPELEAALLEGLAAEEHELLDFHFYRLGDRELKGSTFYGDNKKLNSKPYLDSYLPGSVEWVVLVDSDVLFLGDVCSAKSVFRHMGGSAFGIAPDFSSWYTQGRLGDGLADPLSTASVVMNTHRVNEDWASVNAGVTFWNMNEVRARDWSGALPQLLEASFVAHNVTGLQLGDNDVFVLLCGDHPGLCAIIPSDWNFQLNGNEVFGGKALTVKPSLHSVVVVHGTGGFFRRQLDAGCDRVWQAFAKDSRNLTQEDCHYRLEARTVVDDYINRL